MLVDVAKEDTITVGIYLKTNLKICHFVAVVNVSAFQYHILLYFYLVSLFPQFEPLSVHFFSSTGPTL